MMFSCSCPELTSSYLIVHGSWFSKSAKSCTLWFGPCSGWQVWRCIHNAKADTHPPPHVRTARLMITELRVAAAPPRTLEVSWTVLPRLASSRRPRLVSPSRHAAPHPITCRAPLRSGRMTRVCISVTPSASSASDSVQIVVMLLMYYNNVSDDTYRLEWLVIQVIFMRPGFHHVKVSFFKSKCMQCLFLFW